MGDNCTSSPNSGCSDEKTLEQLTSLSDMIETKLTSIINKKIEIISDLQDCTSSNNAKLEDIISKYQTLINDDCCSQITDNLQNIIDLLNNLIDSASCELDGNIECEIATTTTTTLELTTTTTAIEGTTTSSEPQTTTTTDFVSTTTTTLAENSGIFYVSDIAMLPCIEENLPAENQKTLYYEGSFGMGSQMFIDAVGGTLLTGYSYIKEDGSLNVYNINDESAVVGTVAYTCE